MSLPFNLESPLAPMITSPSVFSFITKVTATSSELATDTSFSSYSTEVINNITGRESTCKLNFPMASVWVAFLPFFTLTVAYCTASFFSFVTFPVTVAVWAWEKITWPNMQNNIVVRIIFFMIGGFCFIRIFLNSFFAVRCNSVFTNGHHEKVGVYRCVMFSLHGVRADIYVEKILSAKYMP